MALQAHWAELYFTCMGSLRAMSLNDSKLFRKRYLKYALEIDLIEMTISDKPNSLSQRYQLKNKVNQ